MEIRSAFLGGIGTLVAGAAVFAAVSTANADTTTLPSEPAQPVIVATTSVPVDTPTITSIPAPSTAAPAPVVSAPVEPAPVAPVPAQPVAPAPAPIVKAPVVTQPAPEPVAPAPAPAPAPTVKWVGPNYAGNGDPNNAPSKD